MATVKKTIQQKKLAGPIRDSNKTGKKKKAKKKLAPSVVRSAPTESGAVATARVTSSEQFDQKNPPLSTALPSYVSFTVVVWQTLWSFKSSFIPLVLFYALLSGLFVGLASQNTYSQLGELIRSAGSEVAGGDSNRLGDAGLLLVVGLSSGLGANLSETEQLMVGLLALIVWLVTIWLLRALLAGHRPRLRDGFYNAGTPIIPTMLLSMVLLLQLIPAAVAMMGISVLLPTGFISGGVSAILFWLVILLLIILSLYWVSSTIMAMVVVTLPGMYPMQALKTARELVTGRRLKIILRMVWLFFAALLLWALIMIPIILFDAWIKGVWQTIEWIPFIPVAWLIVGAVTLVWSASYIYLLYRKVVDDDATSA